MSPRQKKERDYQDHYKSDIEAKAKSEDEGIERARD